MWIVIELVLSLDCYLLLLKIQEQCWELVSCRSKDSHLFVFFVSKRNPICSTKGNLLKIKKPPIPSSWIPIKLWFQSETTQSILFIIRPAHLSKILKTSSKLPQKWFFCKPKRNIFIITAIQIFEVILIFIFKLLPFSSETVFAEILMRRDWRD